MAASREPAPRIGGALEVISRLVGGAAVHTVTLAANLPQRGWGAELVTGIAEEDEETIESVAQGLGVSPIVVESMRRPVRPRDIQAVRAVRRLISTRGPDVVHTHAAKGGAIGRVAALLGRRGDRPALVHTFHGHVLFGYFSERTSAAFVRIERALARRTDAVVVPAAAVRDELVDLGVAPAEKISVIPHGYDLNRFQPATGPDDSSRAATRRSLGIEPHADVVTLVGRLADVKRVDRFLRVARSLSDVDGIRFLVVGSGPSADDLRRSHDSLALGEAVVWAGHRHDMPAIYRASDLVLSTSDHEGAPISMIEAQAAAVPVVSTAVGGVGEVVVDGETGLLAPRDDESRLTALTRELLEDPERAGRLGRAGREHAVERFSVDRMVDDVAGLYESVRANRRSAG